MAPDPTPTEADVGATPEEPANAFRKYRRLVPWAIGLSLATLILLSVWFQNRRGGDVLAELARVEVSALAAALGLHLLMQVAWACRIFVLGRNLGAPVRLPHALALVTSGLFAAAVTPGRVGGEPWRIAMLVRGGASGAAASRTIVADRAVDMLFFLTLGAIAIAVLPSFFGQDVGDVRILGLIALLGLLAMAVAIGFILARPAKMALVLGRLAGFGDRLLRRERKDRTPAIATFFHDITEGLGDLLRRRPGVLVLGAILSFVLWTCELSILWVVLQGFGFDAPYGATYLAGALIVMVASVPALPGGTGVAEVAALALLTPLAPGLTPAFLVAWRGMTYYVDLLAGGLVAGWVARRPARSANPP